MLPQAFSRVSAFVCVPTRNIDFHPCASCLVCGVPKNRKHRSVVDRHQQRIATPTKARTHGLSVNSKHTHTFYITPILQVAFRCGVHSHKSRYKHTLLPCSLYWSIIIFCSRNCWRVCTQRARTAHDIFTENATSRVWELQSSHTHTHRTLSVFCLRMAGR